VRVAFIRTTLHQSDTLVRCYEQYEGAEVRPTWVAPSQESLTTLSARAFIERRVAKEEGMTLIFLESLCDDPAVIAANVALKVSMGDPDYKDMSPEDAKRDFLRRIKEYEAVYETITEPHLSYFKIINIGDQVTVCRIHGYLQSRIAFYLMNLHLKPRSIFFSRVRYAPYRSRRSSSDTFLFIYHPSTARANSTWRAKSAEIRISQNAVLDTQRRCRLSSGITSATRR
jgi:6-phosphofructo-2-kinase